MIGPRKSLEGRADGVPDGIAVAFQSQQMAGELVKVCQKGR